MRDEKDPGPLEMPLAKKRGRPSTMSNGQPMPGALRAKLYRMRKDYVTRDAMTVSALTDRIRWSMTRGMKGVAEMYLEELAKRLAAMPADPPSDD